MGLLETPTSAHPNHSLFVLVFCLGSSFYWGVVSKPDWHLKKGNLRFSALLLWREELAHVLGLGWVVVVLSCSCCSGWCSCLLFLIAVLVLVVAILLFSCCCFCNGFLHLCQFLSSFVGVSLAFCFPFSCWTGQSCFGRMKQCVAALEGFTTVSYHATFPEGIFTRKHCQIGIWERCLPSLGVWKWGVHSFIDWPSCTS